ncbi:aminotransferase [Perkinsela sp. CCAP 1560/4]|nr:aminotransferase [Perkinsela sp. CCAP 1560/4]|eukprot:KNH09215.1 aminotransferase [Perkinsela sp. CCAP 1560/4]
MTSSKILREIAFHESITSINTRSAIQGWNEFDNDFIAATTIEGKLHLIECENVRKAQELCPNFRVRTYPLNFDITACSLSQGSYSTFLIGDSIGRVHRYDPLTESRPESFTVSFEGQHIQHISTTLRRGEITSVIDGSSNLYLYESREMKYLEKIPGKFAAGAVGFGENCILSATHSSAIYVFDIRRTKSALLKLNTEDLVTCISEPIMSRDGTPQSHSVAVGTVGGRCFSFRSESTVSGAASHIPNRCFVPSMRSNRKDITAVNIVPDELITCGDSAGCFSVIDLRSGSLQYLNSEIPNALKDDETVEIVTLGGGKFNDTAFVTAHVSEGGKSVIRIATIS